MRINVRVKQKVKLQKVDFNCGISQKAIFRTENKDGIIEGSRIDR